MRQADGRLRLLAAILVAIGCKTGSDSVVSTGDDGIPIGASVGSPNSGGSSGSVPGTGGASGGSVPYLVQCAIVRDEANAQSERQQPGAATGASQVYYDKSARVANYSIQSATLCNNGPTDTASLNAACHAAFCTKSGIPGYVLDDPSLNNFTSPPTCTATAGTLTKNPPPGVCSKDASITPSTSVLFGVRHASVQCTLAGRVCTLNASSSGEEGQPPPLGVTGYCAGLTPYFEKVQNMPAFRCFDPSSISAYNYCANSWWYHGGEQDFFGYVQLDPASAVKYDDTDLCNGYINPTPPLHERRYGVDRSAVIGTIALGSQTAQLKAKGGYAVIQTSCDDQEGPSKAAHLSRMKLNLQDVALFGIPFTSPTVELLGTTDASSGIILARTMQMEVTTNILGRDVRTQLTNPQDLSISAGVSAFALSGPVWTDAGDVGGFSLPLTVTVNLNASTSSPGANCVGLGRTATILGFEDATLWQSSQSSLALSVRAATQGCYAVDVPGSGYRVLNSAILPTPLQGTTSTLGLDFFVPTNPPNPYWLGAVQMYATCPSANMNNAYIGQVELTGKPLGAYSTLAFPIPPSIRNVLTQTHSDCYFSIAVNEDQTPTPPTLDNLRFLP
jgi:hypothetical protein